MRHRHQLNVERPHIEAATPSHGVHWDFRRTCLTGTFGFKQRSAEGGRVDWHLQARPKVEQCPKMILMRMSENQASDVVSLFHQVADIGEDQINARKMFLRGKGHAKVDSQPSASVLVAEAVNRQIHADLADPAQRGKQQCLFGGHAEPPPKPKTSPAVIAVTLPPCSVRERTRM